MKKQCTMRHNQIRAAKTFKEIWKNYANEMRKVLPTPEAENAG